MEQLTFEKRTITLTSARIHSTLEATFKIKEGFDLSAITTETTCGCTKATLDRKNRTLTAAMNLGAEEKTVHIYFYSHKNGKKKEEARATLRATIHDVWPSHQQQVSV